MACTHFLAALAAAAAFAGAQAQSAGPAGAEPAFPAVTAGAPLVDAEVRKIDTAQGKVTLRHGPIPNLDMPNMTMVFRVSEPKLLEAIQEGDKVKFSADKVNGAYTVTWIQVVAN